MDGEFGRLPIDRETNRGECCRSRVDDVTAKLATTAILAPAEIGSP